ncbi:MAG: hypothetical protein QXV16_02280, partial [Candidatus Anstonellales archaeon]
MVRLDYGFLVIGLLIILFGLIDARVTNLISIYLILGIILSTVIAKNDKFNYFLGLGIISILSLVIFGINLGIEFRGGTRVILQTESFLSNTEMLDLVDRIKSRLSVLGLEQFVVKGIENRIIYIESSTPDLVDRIRNVITRRGEYIGIVDGVVVVRGEDIIPNSVQIILDKAQLGGADWGVQFALNPNANARFLESVRGKANRPIYMFLDPPRNMYILLNRSKLQDPAEAIEVLSYLNITVLWDDEPIDVNDNATIILSNERPYLKNQIVLDESDLYPVYNFGSISSWKAINLISAPRLSPSITAGGNIVGMRYLISGTARDRPAIDEAREIASVLRGGGIPYNLEIIGTTNIPPVFGELSLSYSIAGLILSVISVAIFTAIRYRNLIIAGIIAAITILEMTILLAIVGRFTLDLAAIVGLIAAAGVSIDAQIIITDFRLRRQLKFEEVYRIIKNNTIIAI